MPDENIENVTSKDKEEKSQSPRKIKLGSLKKKTGVKAQNKNSRYMAITIILALIFGFSGGLLATEINSASTSQEIIDNRQEIVLQESQVISEVAETVGPSVVSITAVAPGGSSFFSQGSSESLGSGIIVNSDGLIVTNKHVIPENYTDISITTAEGQEYKDVELIDRDPLNDIAYLRVNGAENLTAAELGNSSEVEVGQKVIAIGNALGQYQNTVTSGIISGIGRPIVAGGGDSTAESLSNLFQTDAAINRGNSGGPLVDTNGRIIGINTAVAGNAENIGFSIPIDDVKPGITSVEETGELVKPFLGIRYIPIDNAVANQFDLSVTEGAYVFSPNSNPIVSGSPADEAGLRTGDIITSIAGIKLTDSNGLASVVGRQPIGEPIDVTILRGGQEQSLQVTLEEVPENL